jgi:hypothetical protein
MLVPNYHLSLAGNPFKSEQVTSLKSGHHSLSRAAGYQQLSAVPWTLADFHAVVDHLEFTASSLLGGGQEAIPLLLIRRDLLLLTILWESMCRGANAGSFRMANLRLLTGAPLHVFPPY